jgi:hypothetical protein
MTLWCRFTSTNFLSSELGGSGWSKTSIVACSSSFSLKLFIMMVSRESNNTPVAVEPLQMHVMGHQSRQNRHGGGGGTSFFLSLV